MGFSLDKPNKLPDKSLDGFSQLASGAGCGVVQLFVRRLAVRQALKFDSRLGTPGRFHWAD